MESDGFSYLYDESTGNRDTANDAEGGLFLEDIVLDSHISNILSYDDIATSFLPMDSNNYNFQSNLGSTANTYNNKPDHSFHNDYDFPTNSRKRFPTVAEINAFLKYRKQQVLQISSQSNKPIQPPDINLFSLLYGWDNSRPIDSAIQGKVPGHLGLVLHSSQVVLDDMGKHDKRCNCSKEPVNVVEENAFSSYQEDELSIFDVFNLFIGDDAVENNDTTLVTTVETNAVTSQEEVDLPQVTGAVSNSSGANNITQISSSVLEIEEQTPNISTQGNMEIEEGAITFEVNEANEQTTVSSIGFNGMTEVTQETSNVTGLPNVPSGEQAENLTTVTTGGDISENLPATTEGILNVDKNGENENSTFTELLTTRLVSTTIYIPPNDINQFRLTTELTPQVDSSLNPTVNLQLQINDTEDIEQTTEQE